MPKGNPAGYLPRSKRNPRANPSAPKADIPPRPRNVPVKADIPPRPRNVPVKTDRGVQTPGVAGPRRPSPFGAAVTKATRMAYKSRMR